MPLSKLITWGLNEDCSHVALVFTSGWVIHSNLVGVHATWIKTMKKTTEVVHAIQLDIPKEKEDEIIKHIMDNYDDSQYGWGEFLYFAWRGLLHRLFRTPFPKKGRWANSKNILCTEILKLLPDEIMPAFIKNRDLGIISPYHVYRLCLEYGIGRNENAYILAGKL
jgi:hypothetical protein